MKNDIDDLLNSVFGSHSADQSLPDPGVPTLTLETQESEAQKQARMELEKAAARRNTSLADSAKAVVQKATAGAQKVTQAAYSAATQLTGDKATPPHPAAPESTTATPRGTAVKPNNAQPASVSDTPSDAAQATASLADALRSADEMQRAVPEMSKALDARLAQQQKEIAELNRVALEDIQRIGRELNTPAVQNLSTRPDSLESGPQPGTAGVGAEGFDGLCETLQNVVFGQDAYLQKLAIAFKRPYVMGHSGDAARNSILITGNSCTGRALSLTALAAALKQTHVFATDTIAWVDLALYPTASEEKLFLQDLYMALAGDAEIVAFVHYDNAYPGFLGVLSALVQNGKSPLANRYVLQNGRLIDAGNALVADAVSTLTPRGKYLVLITSKSVAKVADSFGAPFISSLGDVCETDPLTGSALQSIARAELSKTAKKAEDALRTKLTADDEVLVLAVNAAAGDSGAKGVLTFWDKTYRALAQYKLEHDKMNAEIHLHVTGGAVHADLGDGDTDLFALLPQSYTGEVDAVKAELDDIVGLSEVKKYILSLEDNYKMQARRRTEGLKTASVSMHMIFTGNPGTGKTTIARIVSKYLKAMGVLSGGQLVEVSRADLVGKYVGHTAPMTTQVIKSALGGVLFIDEAYSLYRGKDDSFGLEAIDTLVKGMEDNRDNLIVILAGYSKEMAEFLTANSGLKSRFPNIIEFPDYTGEELLAITKLQIKSKGYVLDESCDTNLLTYFNAVQLTRARDAGNGRLARNKVEEAILNQSKRLLKDEKADLSTLLPEDFELDDVQGK